MSKQFEMPPSYLGQIVRWKPHPGSDGGGPAMVTTLGTNCLGLLVFHAGTVGGLPYDGVLHECDPKYDMVKFDDRGVWGYVEEQDDYSVWCLARPGLSASKAKAVA